jgi:hypothetical protein
MSDIWTSIKQLEGTTLYTAARKKAFRIECVNNGFVFYIPNSTGKERSSLRETFEQIAGLGLKQNELSRSRIDEEITGGDQFNTSYVHAILCALGKAI